MLNKRAYIQRAMIKKALENKNMTLAQQEVLSKSIPLKIKEKLLEIWANSFIKKFDLDKLLGSGAYEFFSGAWEAFETKDDGTINLNFSAFLDYIEEEGFREPKTEFGEKFRNTLKKFTDTSDLIHYLFEILVADGTDELRKKTGILFTKPTKKERLKGKTRDVMSLIPGSEAIKDTLNYVVDLNDRKLALVIVAIPFLLKLIATKITLPFYLATWASTEMTTKQYLAQLIMISLFGSNRARGSIPKKIILMTGGGFFALINDLFRLIGWSYKKIKNFIFSIIKPILKYIGVNNNEQNTKNTYQRILQPT
jgi:hypothetical protein